MRAYVMMETKPGTSEDVVRRIKERVKEVVQADSIYGRFDAIIIIEAPDLDSIKEILYRLVERDPDVVHTETFLALSGE
ncbi:MAG: AsnC family transcriptional regulator [Candidatus Bathyarchaeota archaeon B26-2]|nr:MAG: AsnC family transcriptional regulator [Candidatus Bathyarchaeota archaeon B26-2]